MSVPGITVAVDPVRTATSRAAGPGEKATLAVPSGGTAVPPGGKALPRDAATLQAVHAAAAAIEQHLRESGRQLSFRVDEVTGQTIVTVTNPETGEVVRQLPSEELLRVARDLAVSRQTLISEFA